MSYGGAEGHDVPDGSSLDLDAVHEREDVISERDTGDVPFLDIFEDRDTSDATLDVENDAEDVEDVFTPPQLPRSCAELRRARPLTPSGDYEIDPGIGTPVTVYCDMTTDGGAGYTMKRLDDAGMQQTQAAYRALCAELGMEVIVPRTRAHARSIVAYNEGAPPNLVNVFPKFDGARGLANWEGRCQGEPCSFYLSDTDSANCTGHLEPNGDNSTDFSLYLEESLIEANGAWCFGRWNDQFDRVPTGGRLICSTNDTVAPLRASCQDYLLRDQVHNAGPDGISGEYMIRDEDGEFPVYCDMTRDGGGWTLVWKNSGDPQANPSLSNAELWSLAAAWDGQEPSPLVTPHHLAAGAQVHYRAWRHFGALSNQRWAKFVTLHRIDPREQVHRQSFHVQFGRDTYLDIVANETNCATLEDPVEVLVNGEHLAGRTRYLTRAGYGNNDSQIAYGLAGLYNRTRDQCGQPASEILNDSSAIHRLAGSDGRVALVNNDLRALIFLFSYVHDGTGKNVNRCTYRCWSGDSLDINFYDAFVWGVRGPLVYESCAEVRRIDDQAPAGRYTIEDENGRQEIECAWP